MYFLPSFFKEGWRASDGVVVYFGVRPILSGRLPRSQRAGPSALQ